MTLDLTLPYPPSANRYWRSFVPRGHSRAIVTLSDEAKAYKRAVSDILLLAGVRQPIASRAEIAIALYPRRPLDWAKRAQRDPVAWDDDVMSIDLDNACKVLLDSLKGSAIVDDSRRYVRRIVLDHMEPDAGPPRAVVRITPLVVPAQPQEALFA